MTRAKAQLAALALAFAASAASPGRAQETTPQPGADATATAKACVDQHVLGQQLLKKAKLLEARDTLIKCSSSTCPPVVVGDCSQVLREVEQRIPSVVVGATGPDGRDAVAVRTYVDGRLVSERLDGRPIELDPGEHVFRFELAGARPVEERVVVQDGHRGRRLAIRFGDAGSATSDRPSAVPTSRPVPPLTWVLGGVGVVGLGVFGTFAIIGLDQRSSLDDCKPGCSDDQIDDGGRRSFLIADVALGVGAAALIAAGIVYLARPTVAASTAKRQSPLARGPSLAIPF